MNVEQVNLLLLQENVSLEGVLPRLRRYRQMALKFKTEFGLDELPEEPGLIIIRGARQFGKSTWLEQELAKSYAKYGPGSSFYLNGDEIALAGSLLSAIENLLPLFAPGARVKRIFIDEITAVDGWERALKVLADRGQLDEVLVVTTGSKASDIRRGAERLPGRKGRLVRTNYIFMPIPYREFKRVAQSAFGDQTLISYVVSGGSPLAANELAGSQTLPEYVITLTRDWIIGEVVRSGRQRSMLLRVLQFLHRWGATATSYSKLARDSDFANNTVAAGYIEQLQDLLCVAPTIQSDPVTARRFYRKSLKLELCNLLMAVSTSPHNPRSAADFHALPLEEQGKFYEWLVAQELWRRSSLREREYSGELMYVRDGDNELDFLIDKNMALEVKRGQASPHEFQWALSRYPRMEIGVVCSNALKLPRVKSTSLEQFLLEE